MKECCEKWTKRPLYECNTTIDGFRKVKDLIQYCPQCGGFLLPVFSKVAKEIEKLDLPYVKEIYAIPKDRKDDYLWGCIMLLKATVNQLIDAVAKK